MIRAVAACLVLPSLVLVSGAARADMLSEPESRILEAIQEGQDVSLRLDVPANELIEEHDLTRCEYQNGAYQGEVAVLEDHLFNASDAVDTYTDEWYGDSTVDRYVFVVADECVPPAQYHYRLSSQYSYDTLWVEVEDTGDECLAQYEDSEGAGDEGCSVTGVGRDATAGALGLLMLGVGLAGLRVSRRRH